MSMGFLTAISEFITQDARLAALQSQISAPNVSTNFLFEIAPKQLKEIEEEVRSIANRSIVFDKVANNRLREKRNSVSENLNATLTSLLRAQHPEDSNTQLDAQDRTIHSIYDSQEFMKKLEQAEKELGLNVHSFTSSSSGSSMDSTFLK
jgi:hypothetical protein